MIEIANSDDFDLWCRYRKDFEAYAFLMSKQRNWSMEVIVITGPTGTGKSRYAMDTYPGAYWKPNSKWWDGYMGQEDIIIDEFYGWLPWSFFLALLDRYPLICETKGGHVQMTAKRIVICSNQDPRLWYQKVNNFPALQRRVSKWMVFDTLEDHHEFDNWEQAQPFIRDYHNECLITN